MIYIVLYGSIQDCPLTLAGTHEVVHDVVVVRHAGEDAFYHAFLARRRYLLGVGGGGGGASSSKNGCHCDCHCNKYDISVGHRCRNRVRFVTDISESISIRYRYIGIDFSTISIYRDRFHYDNDISEPI